MSKLFTKAGEIYKYFDELFYGVRINENVGLSNLNKLGTILSIDEQSHYSKLGLNKNSLKELLESIKKMIIRDFISNQSDRHVQNLFFKVSGNSVDLMPIHVYEYSFDLGALYEKYCGIFDMKLDMNSVVEYLKHDSYFQYLLFKSMDMNIDKLLKQCEEENEILIDKVEKDIYRNHIKKSKEKILEYNL